MEDEHEKWIQTGFPLSIQKRYSIVKEQWDKSKKPPRSGLVQQVSIQFQIIPDIIYFWTKNCSKFAVF